jgi:hypothetical protein
VGEQHGTRRGGPQAVQRSLMLAGARMLSRTKTQQLRWVFGVVIAALGVEMLYGALSGKL